MITTDNTTASPAGRESALNKPQLFASAANAMPTAAAGNRMRRTAVLKGTEAYGGHNHGIPHLGEKDDYIARFEA